MFKVGVPTTFKVGVTSSSLRRIKRGDGGVSEDVNIPNPQGGKASELMHDAARIVRSCGGGDLYYQQELNICTLSLMPFKNGFSPMRVRNPALPNTIIPGNPISKNPPRGCISDADVIPLKPPR